MTLSWGHVLFELAKVLMQGAVALLVGFFAVRWALKRYKSEKTWERRLSAYADIVSALSEMRLVVGRWADEMESGREYNQSISPEMRGRYSAARRAFEGSSALARLLLPEDTHTLITKLDQDIAAIDEPDRWTAVNIEFSLIDDALHTLTAKGRTELGLG